MGLFEKLFGFRWSLYFVRNENEIAYMMHENSIMRMIGYVMIRFAECGMPVEPWSIHANFNRTHESFELLPEHFLPNGENVTEVLLNKIASIDPDWMVKGSEPVFVDARTKQKLKISRYKMGEVDFAKALREMEETRELTFYDVLDDVFDFEGDEIDSDV